MSKDIGPAAVENKMMDISRKPVLLTRMFFGKHKGELFKDIPKDYLQWLSKQDDLDEDMRFTVEHYLK
jgi:exodeoxyribonuclease X